MHAVLTNQIADILHFNDNVEKWRNIFLKSCGVHIARFLKYVCPFFNIIEERVNFCCSILKSIEMSGNLGMKLVKM